MKKVIFYIYSLNKGGAERVLVTIIEQLKNYFEIILLTDTISEREYPLSDKIRRETIGACPYPRIFAPFWRVFAIRKVIKKEKNGLLVAFMLPTGIRALIAAIMTKCKVVVAIRSNPTEDYPTKIKRLWTALWLKKAEKIVCQFPSQAEYLPGKLDKKITVIWNPISKSFGKDLPFLERKKKIVSVGRLYDYKNFEMLLKGIQNDKTYFSQYEVKIYGDGPHRTILQRYIDEHELNEIVYLEGEVEDVGEKIKDAELFVLTSNTEGMPNVLIEAMSMGIPVISTDCPCGGPKSLIQHGINGYLCSVNDADELTRLMKDLLKDEKKREMMGNEAKNIKQKCDLDKIIKEWIKLIKEV